MESQKYNSQALQTQFAEVYKNLFSTCATVASAPASFLWGGNYAIPFGGLSIRQTLPLRTYVGLEETAGQEVVINKTTVFTPHQKNFHDLEINTISAKLLVALLKQKITEIIIPSSSFKGLKINILSEIQPSCGLGASSSLAAALAVAIRLHYQQITANEIQQWPTRHSGELMANKNFDLTFRLAWEIEACFHGISSGNGPFTALLGANGPTMYCLQTTNSTTPINLLKESQDGNDSSYVYRLPYMGCRLNEMLNTSFIYPFDFGIIITEPGRLKILSDKVMPKELKMALKELIIFFKNNIGRYYQNRKLQPLFGDLFEQENIDQLHNSYLSVINILTLNTLKGLVSLNSSQGLPRPIIQSLFENLNKFQGMLKILNLSATNLDHLCGYLANTASKIDEYGIGLQQLGTDKGGGAVFTIASQKMKDYLPQLLQQFREQNNEQMNMVYLSWRDGLDDKGVIIEQSLKNNIYSQFISRGSMQILHLDHYGPHEDLYTLDEFNKIKKDIDILLDAPRNEIWIRGEKLTSKDLRTASHTIQVMKILLENVGTELSKSKLPASGYLQDRNEFQSKIASPLVKTVEQRLGRRISFNVQGAIVDFTVTFDPNNVEFHYIKQEF